MLEGYNMVSLRSGKPIWHIRSSVLVALVIVLFNCLVVAQQPHAPNDAAIKIPPSQDTLSLGASD